MTDIRIISNDAGDIQFDIGLASADLQTDDGLETAVTISLFSNATAPADLDLPNPDGDRQGWWGDAYADIPGDQTGSLLWTLGREKQLSPVLKRAQDYAQAALAWLITDGVAKAVAAVASFPQLGWIQLAVTITALSGVTRTYAYQWRAS